MAKISIDLNSPMEYITRTWKSSENYFFNSDLDYRKEGIRLLDKLAAVCGRDLFDRSNRKMQEVSKKIVNELGISLNTVRRCGMLSTEKKGKTNYNHSPRAIVYKELAKYIPEVGNPSDDAPSRSLDDILGLPAYLNEKGELVKLDKMRFSEKRYELANYIYEMVCLQDEIDFENGAGFWDPNVTMRDIRTPFQFMLSMLEREVYFLGRAFMDNMEEVASRKSEDGEIDNESAFYKLKERNAFFSQRLTIVREDAVVRNVHMASAIRVRPSMLTRVHLVNRSLGMDKACAIALVLGASMDYLLETEHMWDNVWVPEQYEGNTLYREILSMIMLLDKPIAMYMGRCAAYEKENFVRYATLYTALYSDDNIPEPYKMPPTDIEKIGKGLEKRMKPFKDGTWVNIVFGNNATVPTE